ncbi:MAG TPA: PAS domain S-box protein [Methanoregula sp.]|nr:PAS domain S-box protein [Methanoregula sp.]
MKIRTQLIAGIVIFALLIVVISGLVIVTNQQVDRLAVQEHTANTIALDVGELGYLSNDYILYREPQQAERWDAKSASIAGEIANLSADQPEQKAIIGNLAANINNTRTVFEDIASSPVQSSGSQTDFIQLSWTRMAVQNQEMIFDADRLATLVRGEADGLKQTGTLLIFALMGAFVALLLSGYGLFYRRTLRSLSNLQEGADAVGSGDFGRIVDESSDDEIGDLARTFNRMTANLRQVTATKSELEREVGERRRAEEDLAQKNEELGELNEELTAAHEELVGANEQLYASERNLLAKNSELGALNEELAATQDTLTANLDRLTRAEHDARTSEERYRRLFSEMAEGFAVHEIVCNPSGEPVDYRFLDVNPAFEELTGLKRGDIAGRLATEVLPGLEPEWIAMYGSVALTGTPVHFDNYAKPLDRYYEVFAYCPEPNRFATVFMDITERRYDEDILRLTGEVYRVSAGEADLDQILGEYARLLQRYTGCDSIGIRLLDSNGNIPYHANIGFSEDFYNRESPLSIETDSCMCINVVRGKTDPSLPFYTTGGSFYINATTKFLSTVSDEEKGKTRNVCNQVGYESVALIPIRKGEQIIGLLHLADRREGMVPLRTVRILETIALSMGSPILRRQAEEALRQSESRYRDMFELNRAVMLLVDPVSGRLLDANASALAYYGYSREELLGLSISDINISGPVATANDMAKAVKNQGAVFSFRHRKKSGELRDVEVFSAPITLADRQVLHSIIQDVTERKRGEETIQHQGAVMEAINRIFSAALTSKTEEELSRACIAAGIGITGSSLGFTCRAGTDGSLNTCTTTDPRFDPETYPVRGFCERVLSGAASLVAYGPGLYRPDDGSGSGDLRLESFLCVPFLQENRVAGIIGVANREGGYGPEEKNALEAIAPAIVEAFGRKRAEIHLAENLAVMTRLHDVSTRFAGEGDRNELLTAVLDAAHDISGADLGMVQTVVPGTKILRLTTQRGFDQPFLDFFATADERTRAACTEAFRLGRRVIVEDVGTSPIYEDAPGLSLLLEAGIRSVQATPLWSRSGRIVGILTTMWKSPHRPDDRTLRFIDLLARQAADFIERSQAEETLRETSQYLENLITYANAPIIVWDTGHQITRFNHAFERLTGRSAAEMIGHRLEILFPGESLFDSMRMIQRASAGERMESVEIPVRHANGEVRTVLWNSATVYEADGKTVYATIAQGQDITERKRAELVLLHRNEELGALNEELTSTQEELQQNVSELERSEQVLRRSEAELKEALEEKEVLLSEIHHRVKNNLAAFISLISLDNTYEQSEEGQALKKDLQNRARSMALIHETLYRTKKYSSVDMGVYLGNLMDQIAASYATATSVKIVVEAEGTLLDIARATPCGLIINELVTNSFKYAFPESFDCMKTRNEPCTVRVSMRKSRDAYTLVISDNGVGFPPGLDIANAKSLGLKLVNFLARHQLRATVETRSATGAEFVIRFRDSFR